MLERLPAETGPFTLTGHERPLLCQYPERWHLFGSAARARGEITPQGLIAIGEVAARYDLYTKITGGQRIDLFGARLDQLPAIWETLLEAGFETGHAYGKSLRTVKSCVGSTWCRYGVQDSTAFAIELENRYKGLRAPHKIKMAVSGCTRECAEAQSKDIRVIATENGWNLYVCGNGGMKPRHAELFASDLDDDTLIRYVDRILMFYVRTADRLQRTSVWMDNMEGGLDYLREVVIHDSLGIAATLEQDMQQVVDTWQCEWQTTLADPSRRALFTATVNSDHPDETLHYARVRGQRQPHKASGIPLMHLPAEPWSEICPLEAIRQRPASGPVLAASVLLYSVWVMTVMRWRIVSQAAKPACCHAASLAMLPGSRW